MTVKKNHLIEKSNFLNEIKYCEMNLQELRFLAIYLSKINARNPETKRVCFSLNDFSRIMDLGRLNLDNLKANTKKLLQNVVTIKKINNKGYTQFQLFKECEVFQDDNGEYFIQIEAHTKALPYFFELKENHPYFSYRLWNILQLSGPNQQRMYELLKQHQKQSIWTCDLVELKELLFINISDYPRFYDFKIRVLEICKNALSENTDIRFEYLPIKIGRKISKIKFIIKENTNYNNQITLSEFLQIRDNEDTSISEPNYENKSLALLADACDNSFSESQIQELFYLVNKAVPYTKDKASTEQERYIYLAEKYTYSKNRATSKGKVFNYLKTVLEADTQS